MSYEVLEVVALPIMEIREIHPGVEVPVATGDVVRKEVGDTITKAELDHAGQTAEDIESLIQSGAIEDKS